MPRFWVSTRALLFQMYLCSSVRILSRSRLGIAFKKESPPSEARVGDDRETFPT